jgi:hypothetical protein
MHGGRRRQVGLTVLVVGSGGREHSLVWKIAQSPLVDKIFAAPGNPGMAKNAELVPISVDEISRIVDFAVKQKVDLTVVGPEMPLAAGITDDLVRHGLLVCGPSRAAAQLEGSKVFTKNILAKYGIPTADFRVFDTYDDAEQYVLTHRLPVVIKADGLAAGKGVSVAGTYEEAVEFLRNVMEKRIFGAAGERVVVEECLTGEEASYIVFTDGEKIVPLPSSQDHKRIGDGDTGPNTGGDARRRDAVPGHPLRRADDRAGGTEGPRVQRAVRGPRGAAAVHASFERSRTAAGAVRPGETHRRRNGDRSEADRLHRDGLRRIPGLLPERISDLRHRGRGRVG